jgi:MFS family permease
MEVGKIMYREHRERLLLCFALMSVQAFFYNAFFFGHVDVLLKPLAADTTQMGWYLLPLALGNFAGPILLGGRVDGNNGRRRTMAMTFSVSGVLLAITASLFAFSGEGGPIGFGPTQFTLAWTAIFFFASTAASTAYLTAGEQFPSEIRALAFAIVFATSMGVGGGFGPWLFNLVVNEESRRAIAAIYLFVAMLMAAVAVAVAPLDESGNWLRRLLDLLGLLKLLEACRLSLRIFPELSGKPVKTSTCSLPVG